MKDNKAHVLANIALIACQKKADGVDLPEKDLYFKATQEAYLRATTYATIAGLKASTTEEGLADMHVTLTGYALRGWARMTKHEKDDLIKAVDELYRIAYSHLSPSLPDGMSAEAMTLGIRMGTYAGMGAPAAFIDEAIQLNTDKVLASGGVIY